MGSEIRKTRPVVVVSQKSMNQYLETVVACPLTAKLHPQWRSRIAIECNGKSAEIAVDQIRCLSKKRFIKKIDELAANEAEELRDVIAQMYAEL
jgi:mRNA interferase MazF